MEEKDLKEISENISYLIDSENDALIRNIVYDIHPADIADIIHYLREQDRDYLFKLLEVDVASDVLSELDDVSRNDVLEDMDSVRLTEIIDEMDSDDATDLVSDLPQDIADKVLSQIDLQDSEEVKELLVHDEETAGGIMAKEFVSINMNSTVDEAIQEIRRKSEEVEDIFYVYVVDDEGRLVGNIPLKNLILSKPSNKVSQVMETNVVSVKPDVDQEEVANISKRYDLVSIPVTGDDDVLIGRITFDDVVDVIEEEASEDIQRMAGISDEEEFRETSAFRIMRVRLPWLLVGFVGQIVAAFILQHFEASMKQIIAAAFFIPIIMAMGGNSGIQSSTIMVRGMATGEISIYRIGRRVLREVLVSLMNGVVCGALILVVVAVWLDSLNFGIIIAVAMLAVMVNASLSGAVIPVILRRFDIDPAIATGPFITTSNDVVGLLIYFFLITTFLPWL
ncbi:MAG: magnesium transporter [candidate division KSB1 bacterium]|jgi:magnesium transporter|nr:magnesium transporter [candidate division KSB1 bacterium]